MPTVPPGADQDSETTTTHPVSSELQSIVIRADRLWDPTGGIAVERLDSAGRRPQRAADRSLRVLTRGDGEDGST
ncbi:MULTISPECIES: hypothetical protein [unclassified Rhizobium]|jgi:hypothetical protein|uniref:hypothetical protein n=1 Tax=unclassified Rhizobium TaxID=2613769 RepID=UPI000ABE869D|nr:MULTISPECIES: hypothetical protein [unclassified Rhizobium]RKD61496.1 hypothetical protein BJ928_10797 [Rhizobium sp. WW_1]